MIKVRLVGHIRTSVGADFIVLEENQLDAEEIVERARAMVKSGEPGFNRFNTLVVVEDGEAFVPSSVKRSVKDGESVVLIPFSHGG